MWAVIERARKILLILLLSSVPLLLIFVQNKNKEIRKILTWPLVEISGTIENISLNFAKSISDFLFSYFYMASRAQELRELRAKIEEAERLKAVVFDLINERSLILELKDLKKGFGDNVGQIAQVVAKMGSPLSRMIRINKGKNHGIRALDPVIDNQGLVGQVLTVSSNFSDVLLISDSDSAFDAKILERGARGLVKGVPSAIGYILEFSDIDPLEEIKPGDMVLTSGVNSKIPNGIPVGKVIKLEKSDDSLTLKATLEPCVKFSNLSYVTVLTNLTKNKGELYESPWPIKAK